MKSNTNIILLNSPEEIVELFMKEHLRANNINLEDWKDQYYQYGDYKPMLAKDIISDIEKSGIFGVYSLVNGNIYIYWDDNKVDAVGLSRVIGHELFHKEVHENTPNISDLSNLKIEEVMADMCGKISAITLIEVSNILNKRGII